MFDQIARKHIDQALRDQADDGACQVGTRTDVAQGEAEVDNIGGISLAAGFNMSFAN